MIKNCLIPLAALLFALPVFSQTSFKVTYNDQPACNTAFTVTDTSENVLGTGTSDADGKFTCDCNIDNNAPAVLKADPVEKGAKWTLMLPTMSLMKGSFVDYDVKIEVVEEMAREAMELQNEMLGGANDQNDDMNTSMGGGNEGSKELGMIGGLVKGAHAAADAQFKVIKSSMNKSCGGTSTGLPSLGGLGFGKGKKEKKEKAEKNKEVKETKADKEAKVEKVKEEKKEKVVEKKEEVVATFPEGKKGESIKRAGSVKVQKINAEKSKIDITIAEEQGKLQKIKSKKKINADKVRAKEIDIELLEKEKAKLDLQIEKAQTSADGKLWTEADQLKSDERKKAIKEEMKVLEKEQKKL